MKVKVFEALLLTAAFGTPALKLDDAKGFEAYPPEGGEDLLLRASYIRSLDFRSLDFLVRCPPEIAWHVLGYWRCQYTADTQLIDQLGVH